jgi:Fe2+ or Zn2+ uptake regulation protein
METSIESLSNLLKGKGIRPSYQRVKILEYLYRKGGHPTADEVFRTLSPEIPSLSKVTIYNTLHTFIEAGLVRVVDIDESEMRYDVILSNHGHFLCETCGTIYNFKAEIDQLSFEDLNSFMIKEKNIYFKGLCPNCFNNPSEIEKEYTNDR